MKNVSELIRADQKGKTAYIYVRQSSYRQMYEHQESAKRQYELKERAQKLGWAEELIKTIDEDQGQSASDAHEIRNGFERMYNDVAHGQVGAIFAVEVSRLARQDSEWHRLIEIAALTDTLLIDENEIYDPRRSDHRLLLGLKGLLSSNEVRLMKMRLWENRLRKAERGELRINLPIGFIFDPVEGVMMDPNKQIQERIELLFERYRIDGTISGAVRYFQANNLLFPKRERGWDTAITWGPLSCQRFSAILHNPIYAGAYAFGRKTKRIELKPVDKQHQKTVDLPPESWPVILWDLFDGYITRADYEENQSRLLRRHGRHQNRRKDGHALLTGLALCGKCGQRLQVRYSGKDAQLVTYLCNHRQRRYAEAVCQQISGKNIDLAVADAALNALTSAQIDLALAVFAELEEQQATLRRQWEHQIKAAEYAVRQAERRYENVDPENRLVVSSLEARWNSALHELATLENEFTHQMNQAALSLDDLQKSRLHELVHDLPALWSAHSTSSRDRKELLQLLLTDVTLTHNETNVLATIRWHTNHTTQLSIGLTKRGAPTLDNDCIELIRSLVSNHTDAEIATLLNQRKLLTSQGKPFNATRIAGIRQRYDISKS